MPRLSKAISRSLSRKTFEWILFRRPPPSSTPVVALITLHPSSGAGQRAKSIAERNSRQCGGARVAVKVVPTHLIVQVEGILGARLLCEAFRRPDGVEGVEADDVAALTPRPTDIKGSRVWSQRSFRSANCKREAEKLPVPTVSKQTWRMVLCSKRFSLPPPVMAVCGAWLIELFATSEVVML